MFWNLSLVFKHENNKLKWRNLRQDVNLLMFRDTYLMKSEKHPITTLIPVFIAFIVNRHDYKYPLNRHLVLKYKTYLKVVWFEYVRWAAILQLFDNSCREYLYSSYPFWVKEDLYSTYPFWFKEDHPGKDVRNKLSLVFCCKMLTGFLEEIISI